MQVEKVARLARLSLKEEEREELGRQLQDILHFVHQLQEVDTEGIEPLVPIFEETPMREDEPKRDFDPELVLGYAPEGEGSFFVVPRVVEY
ncbi:MAG: Asp-tRNA(Asn)/Glu-tRNA(Gln) amidotransferase subunit GatC [Aquificaceae bacterium]|nr:Asp-tRNA(Asn)/Glu-tRNA(Gln) amidotransferase subunit GatC [Aquificaceae bacterium]MCS7195679.1 Asp-tRNA(Asn)/Glu-tRNA(Gln) amidotransferase subunit GatC [Aquificaceae bacterium]MDW8032927.1 Asp-tRNA(Asn)/Glu-tRNA(Gln) amidotransferase subunit GatC [Aquificaceae bacterium]MDW8294801.1 Asp-tRNA(Asn)/Glu-tRNA(Gln) amidotransferase subunit GatC [Aquificaceae bacterium]